MRRFAMDGNGVALANGVIAHARGPPASGCTWNAARGQSLWPHAAPHGVCDAHDCIVHDQRRYASHSFLDVLNPDTKRWETQDADYDLYWVSIASGERVSLAEAPVISTISDPADAMMSRDGNSAKSLIELLDILSITRKERDVRYSVYTPRANIERTLSIGGRTGTYCELMPKRCRDGFHPNRSSSGRIVEARFT